MMKVSKSLNLFLIIFLSLVSARGFSQNSTAKVTIGAYYFDGWTGAYPWHITPKLTDSFPERKPKWGWITSTQSAIDDQIKLASNSGISFFDFCYYYNGKTNYKQEPLNHALGLYLKSPLAKQLKFCLMVTNHKGFFIRPADWDTVTNELITYFLNPQYLTVDGKPLVTIFSVASLLNQFGSTGAVKQALDKLRDAAKKKGLKGVEIAACENGDPQNISLAKSCGFDMCTGYNYHDAGFKKSQKVAPVDSLATGSVRVWNKFAGSGIPYIPVATLNWDPRPWNVPNSGYVNSSVAVGYSGASVYKSVLGIKNWILSHPGSVSHENIGILYAWNEYGEGGYLTPSGTNNDLLNAVKKALLY